MNYSFCFLMELCAYRQLSCLWYGNLSKYNKPTEYVTTWYLWYIKADTYIHILELIWFSFPWVGSCVWKEVHFSINHQHWSEHSRALSFGKLGKVECNHSTSHDFCELLLVTHGHLACLNHILRRVFLGRLRNQKHDNYL